MAEVNNKMEDEIIGVSPGEEFKLLPTIKIIGVGGAGSNMADWLYKMNIKGAEVIAANTDYAHLKIVKAHKKILLGKEVTRGLGAGGLPSKGMDAARSSQSDIRKLLEGADMVWILLGLRWRNWYRRSTSYCTNSKRSWSTTCSSSCNITFCY